MSSSLDLHGADFCMVLYNLRSFQRIVCKTNLQICLQKSKMYAYLRPKKNMLKAQAPKTMMEEEAKKRMMTEVKG